MSLPQVSEAAGTFVLANFAKVTLVLSIGWLVCATLRRRSAALRHQVCVAAIVAALAVPMLASLLPSWHSSTLGLAVARWGIDRTPQTGLGSRAIPSVVVDAVSGHMLAQSWPAILFGIWAVGCLLLLLRVSAGMVRVAIIGARSNPMFESDWMRDVVRISNSLGISRPIRLLQAADRTAMPLTWGVIQSKILLPASALGWPEGRRRIVLGHELAHIARRDCLWQVLAELMCALYWFHPLAWLAAGRLRREGECACDDSVLNSGVEASGYADNLLDLARTLNHRERRWLPALAMARSSQLERRFIAMLNTRVDRRVPSVKFKLLTSLAALCVLIPLAAVRLPAQNESGKIGGTVYDPSGAAIPNATIIMIGQEADTRDMTSSDAAGKFEFAKLPAGHYEMRVLKPGFKVYTVPSVALEPGRDFSQDVRLEIGAMEESVRVEGHAPSDSGNTSAAVAKEEPKRIRIGGDVEAAHVITRVDPVYPEAAKAAGVHGIVILHAVIGKDGTPLSLRVMNGEVDPQLARSAVEAVSRWRYRSTLLNGEPVEVDTTIEVNFTLSR
jgi:TonB family protein